MTRIKMDELKERKRSPVPSRSNSPVPVITTNYETKISALAKINRLSRLNSFQRTTTPVLDMIETASNTLTTIDRRDQFIPDDDEDTVSLDFSGSDETTISSDDSDTERRRHHQKQVPNDKSVHIKRSRQQPEELRLRTHTNSGKELDVEKYMAGREMTPFQERMNAVTVVPGAFYCIMVLLSGSWLSKTIIEGNKYEQDVMDVNTFDDSQCISWAWLPHLHALPPLPPVAVAIGIVFHAPFSFIYHWKYAHRLPPGLARTTHWSRRMDQAMIHFCCACMSYATSGKLDFFFVNFLYNADCFVRQFFKRVQPRRNQVRIGISVAAYTIPILRREEFLLYSKLGVLFVICGWLFRSYPIGGWSHSAFHIVLAFVPPMLMTAALELPASQNQLRVAVQCASLAKENFVL